MKQLNNTIHDMIELTEKTIGNKLNEFPPKLLTQSTSSPELEHYKDEIRKDMMQLDELILRKEFQIFQQNKETEAARRRVEAFLKHLIDLNSVDYIQQPGEYIHLQNVIKDTIDVLLERENENSALLERENEKNTTHFMEEKRSIAEPQPQNLAQVRERSGKKIRSQSDNKLHKKHGSNLKSASKTLMLPEGKFLVPFRTKEECMSRAISKSTYTSKDDLIKMIERLGMKKQFKNALSSYTKEDLCNGYFAQESKDISKKNKKFDTKAAEID